MADTQTPLPDKNMASGMFEDGELNSGSLDH